MAKNTTNLIDEVITHHEDADTNLETIRGTWPEKENMLVGKLSDDISNSTKSQVFDPRLSTIVYERAARVMAQNPTGKAWAVSKDDVGKNKLMNLYLDEYVVPNANSQFPFLTKLRLLDVYSLTYGVMFALHGWRNDEEREYYGPDFWILPIRDCFPQPGAISIEESDWFQVSTLKTKQWIEDKKGKKGWKNINKLLEAIDGSDGVSNEDKDSDKRSEEEKNKFPSPSKDKAFPKFEIITEYRKDKWITFAKDQRLILRDIKNPNKNGRIPVSAKYAFPQMDNIFGLGEFERGRTLQLALNSLWNLYLDGVKFSLYPPMQINPDGVVKSSIRWAPAAKWLVNRPNVDIQVTQMSPKGLDTFQSTYGFLISSIMNQAGTTDTTVTRQTDPSLGKTPQALQMLEARENSRDNWDRFMMDQFLQDMFSQFIDMTTEKLDKRVAIRLFAGEIEDIAESMPDVLEMFESSKGKDVDGKEVINPKGRAQVKFNKKDITSKWDYQIDSGSTMRKDSRKESDFLSSLLELYITNPNYAQALQMKGKDVDIAELSKRLTIVEGVQDWDRIIVDADLPEEPAEPNVDPLAGAPVGPQIPGQVPGVGIPPAGPEIPQAPQGMNITDPDILAVAQQMGLMPGGIRGIPGV